VSMEERAENELARSASVLDDVERSLERLSDGSYGTCEVCHAPIAEADLEHDPTRRRCGQHVSEPSGGM
jgi:RNA polymerase-binding transcription factor DksA